MSRAETILGERVLGERAELRSISGQVRTEALARDRLLPVLPALASLLPGGGMRRGTTVSITGPAGAAGVASLTLAMVAAASRAGSWCGVVSWPELGMVAAQDSGIELHRFALVPDVAPAQWPVTVGALLDAMEVVVARAPRHLRLGDARRLATRARERGAVLIVPCGWPERTDLSLRIVASRWEGPGKGEGHLSARRVELQLQGRGEASRERRVTVWLPSPTGAPVALESETAPDLPRVVVTASAG